MHPTGRERSWQCLAAQTAERFDAVSRVGRRGNAMTVQTLNLSGKSYVLLPKKDFRRLTERLARYDAEERLDAAVVRKRLKDKRTLIPLAQVKKELGL
jgi:hypothetical protein